MATSTQPTTVVILAAGLGKRMKSDKPKVLATLCGRPMIAWVIDQALALEPKRILVVIGHGREHVEAALDASGQRKRVTLVTQAQQLGTGHAVQVCLPELGRDPGRVVVLYGDMPVLSVDTLESLLDKQRAEASGGAAILTARPDDARGFGRVLRVADPDAERYGEVECVVEERDCTSDERAIDEVNTGVYVFDGRALVETLPKLSNDNAQKEYYLTDVLALFVAAGRAVSSLTTDDQDEIIGVNDLADLAEARLELQHRIHDEHMQSGVFIEDPSTTYIDHGVTIGAGTRILPCTVIRSGCKVGSGCEVGPFAQLRTGTVLEDGAEIGNFTECKNSRIGAHAKAKHLAYLGDATIGARVNVGAGTIFANYDGQKKHATHVGERAFLGSGTVIVAPNTIGAGATTGAGAVVTRGAKIGAGEVWVGVPARKLAPKSATHPASEATATKPASVHVTKKLGRDVPGKASAPKASEPKASAPRALAPKTAVRSIKHKRKVARAGLKR